MTDTKKTLYNVIDCIDIIAMFMILFYHSAYYISIVTGTMDKTITILITFFVFFGLTAFTYSSGFKLSFNHYKDFENKTFYKKYMISRTVSLYKIYLLYPLGCTIFLYFLHYIFGLAGEQAVIMPYFQQIAAVNMSTIIDFLFFGLTPVGGQLWYIFVLMIINFISLAVIRIYGAHSILKGLFPFLCLYFFFNFHVLDHISPKELPYYICLYMTIFLSGMFMGYLYHENRMLFYKTLFGLSGMFILVMIGYIEYDANGAILSNNYYFKLIYGNLLFKYGLTFPGFLMAVLLLLKDTRIVSVLSVYRKYILIVYMLQYPFTIPFYSILLSKIGFYSTQTTNLAPLLVSFFSILTCIGLYNAYIRIPKIKLLLRQSLRT